jgi:hypothetical protein
MTTVGEVVHLVDVVTGSVCPCTTAGSTCATRRCPACRCLGPYAPGRPGRERVTAPARGSQQHPPDLRCRRLVGRALRRRQPRPAAGGQAEQHGQRLVRVPGERRRRGRLRAGDGRTTTCRPNRPGGGAVTGPGDGTRTGRHAAGRRGRESGAYSLSPTTPQPLPAACRRPTHRERRRTRRRACAPCRNGRCPGTHTPEEKKGASGPRRPASAALDGWGAVVPQPRLVGMPGGPQPRQDRERTDRHAPGGSLPSRGQASARGTG